jgi:hypothetical protein
MLEEQDQLLLINLFIAAILYVNTKTEDRNPFVKTLTGETISEQKAFTILLNACNELAHLKPLLEEVDSTIKSVLNDTQDFENKEVSNLPTE